MLKRISLNNLQLKPPTQPTNQKEKLKLYNIFNTFMYDQIKHYNQFSYVKNILLFYQIKQNPITFQINQ